MNENSGGPDESAAAKATRELAQLHVQTDEARVLLSQLQREVVAAENRLNDKQATQLVEANEQLILSALRAHTNAEVSEQALHEVSLWAERDALTALPNRVLLLDRLAQVIAHARRNHARFALLFLDLNNFKQINDTLGHQVGDEVLKLAARCFVSSVREADTVCRYGGDEFLILLSEVSQASDVVMIAEKVIAMLAAPSRVGDHVLRLTASIGISIYPDDGEEANTLIERADAAMYRAKTHGLSSFLFYGKEAVSEQSRATPALASLQQPVIHYELALAEHERRHAQQLEANERLVIAALNAQELQTAAELARHQQTEFLAVLAHELRNPLAPIRTAAALLGRLPADELLLPRVQAIIEKQVVHMARLVDDLLDVSRVHTGKLRLECRVVDMVGIIDAAVDACRPAMDTRLQQFIVHMPSCTLEVYGDPVRLAQILSNLFDNASKYTPNGGKIELSVVVIDDAIVINASDNGIGITAEVLPTIFQPFVQGVHAVDFNGIGLGIGLTVVRELVEAHHGKVVASSEGSGLGSQFVVTLPLTGRALFTK